MAILSDRNTLHDWLAFISQQHPASIKLGLTRVHQVYERMGISPNCPVITVAGTNGKGSSVAMLGAILAAAGYSTGIYTSPHLVTYNERVVINGAAVTDQYLCDGFAAVEAARGDVPLTYFEFGTLCAFWCFAQQQLDVWILETGLGGRLDAVNILDADAALITHIGLDHQQWLGNSRELIAREKAGIMRAGHTAICADPVAPGSIDQYAHKLGTTLLQTGQDFSFSVSGDTWKWKGAGQCLDGLPHPALAGSFQIENAAGVLAVLLMSGLPFVVAREAIAAGLQQIKLRGRFQLLSRAGSSADVYVDVAHNVDSARALAGLLQLHPGATRAVWSMLRDKDMEAVASVMQPHIDFWYLASLPAERAADTAMLKDALHKAGVEADRIMLHETVQAAFEAATGAAGDDERILVFGSFETVGGILATLDNSQPD